MYRTKRPHPIRVAIAFTAALLCCVTSLAHALPNINGISPQTQHLSGYLEITGEGRGSSGQVFIDNRVAFTSTWTDTRVVAYIPETSSLGAVSVSIRTPEGSSNSSVVDVSQRQ